MKKTIQTRRAFLQKGMTLLAVALVYAWRKGALEWA